MRCATSVLLALLANRQLALQHLVLLIDQCLRVKAGAFFRARSRRRRHLARCVMVVRTGAEAVVVGGGGRTRQLRKSAGGRRRWHAGGRSRGILRPRMRQRGIGRRQRNRRRGRGLSPRAILRPCADQDQAESQEQIASRLHLSNSLGSTIDRQGSSGRAGKNISSDMVVKLDGNGSELSGMTFCCVERLTHVKPAAGRSMA